MMKDQRSELVFPQQLPSEGFLPGNKSKSSLGECVSLKSLFSPFHTAFQLYAVILKVFPCLCVREVLPFYHHGGAGLLPRGGIDVFLWSDESLEGRPGGAK